MDPGLIGISPCYPKQGINQNLLVPRQKVPLVISTVVTLWARLFLSGNSFTEAQPFMA